MTGDISKGKKRKRTRKGEPVTGAHAVAEGVMAAAEKRDFSAAERRRLASEGNALPDGSYPVESAADLENAAHLIRTGHGDVDAARRLVARRARELNVPNPLEKNMSQPGNPVQGVRPDARMSTPLTQDHAAYSVGHHISEGSQNPGWAQGHPDRDTPGSNPILRMMEERMQATSSYPASRGVMYGDEQQSAAVSQMPLGQSGRTSASYRGMNEVPVSYARPDESSARLSATGPNGGHDLGDVTSHAVAGKTATPRADALRLIREEMTRQGWNL